MTKTSSRQAAGMRFVFWLWTAVIAGGLAVMIILPLTGA